MIDLSRIKRQAKLRIANPDPETVLAMVAVVRAAQNLDEWLYGIGMDQEGDASVEFPVQQFRAALAPFVQENS